MHVYFFRSLRVFRRTAASRVHFCFCHLVGGLRIFRRPTSGPDVLLSPRRRSANIQTANLRPDVLPSRVPQPSASTRTASRKPDAAARRRPRLYQLQSRLARRHHPQPPFQRLLRLPTPLAQLWETSPYIPPNPPVPSSCFGSTVISEAGATETVPVPLSSCTISSVAPAPSGYAPSSSYASGTGVSVAPTYTGPPATGAGNVQKPLAGLLAAALGFAAMF